MKNLNLTPRAQKLIKEALKVAVENKHHFITHTHIFIAFLNLKQNQIDEAFIFHKYNIDHIRAQALKYIVSKTTASKKAIDKAILSDQSKEVFNAAKQLSTKYDHKYIGLEHIFLSLFEIYDGVFLEFQNETKLNLLPVIEYIENKLEEDDLLPAQGLSKESPSPETFQLHDAKKYKLLNTYGINLNSQVANGKISHLHINQELIKKLSEVLCRKNKNNPLIVGEAGVGKTALVESLAQAIVLNECSDLLGLKQIYSLDISMMIAGCKYRGEFEEKIKNLLKEVINDPYIILFIDEIHTIIGAGNPENGNDVANILKPYLARGDISCIGATTFDEYKKTISNDPALSRRFQIIKMEEPTKDQTFNLIQNIKQSYETYHTIHFSDDIVKYIINIAEKYIEGRFPDKALDVIDQVGSKAKLKNFCKSAEMIKIENKLNKLSEKKASMNEQKYIEFENALFEKYQKSIDKMVSRWKNNKYTITEDDVLEVVSDKTNIPINDLKKQDLDKVKNLKTKLLSTILGQSNQIQQIYKCLVRAKAGFRNPNKPICSMLFAGPTGVGKTLTAKILAENLFINKNNFISIDMSEYADKTSVNKLIGSSPGYIGYDKGGVLTEKVRKNPYSLVLFDEIQKADEDVLYTLFQILEEGRLSDSNGKMIDFSNTIVIMTTNIGAQIATETKIGFNSKPTSVKNDVFASVKKYFPSDLLNRIDEIIVFDILNDSYIKEIIVNELNNFKEELKSKNIGLSFSSDISEFIFKKIQFNNFGARQVIKTIQRELQTQVAEKILEQDKISTLEISIKDDNICVI